MSPGLDPLYGKDIALEIEYAPFGAPTGLCVGLGGGPSFLDPVTLLACGVNNHTLWIEDLVTTRAGLFAALISGTTSSNFQHPPALTAEQPGLPLQIAALVSGAPAATLNHQLWNLVPGILPAP